MGCRWWSDGLYGVGAQSPVQCVEHAILRDALADGAVRVLAESQFRLSVFYISLEISLAAFYLGRLSRCMVFDEEGHPTGCQGFLDVAWSAGAIGWVVVVAAVKATARIQRVHQGKRQRQGDRGPGLDAGLGGPSSAAGDAGQSAAPRRGGYAPLRRRQGPCGRLWTAACRKVEDGSDG